MKCRTWWKAEFIYYMSHLMCKSDRIIFTFYRARYLSSDINERRSELLRSNARIRGHYVTNPNNYLQDSPTIISNIIDAILVAHQCQHHFTEKYADQNIKL